MSDEQPATREVTVNIGEYWRIVMRRKLYLILSFIVVAGGAVALTYFLDPEYQSTTLVLVGKTNILGREVAVLTPGVEAPRRVSTDRLREQYRSRLVSIPYLIEMITTLRLLDSLPVRETAVDGTPLLPETRIALLAESIRDRIDVDLRGENILQIRVTASSPTLAMRMASELAEVFKRNMLREELATIRRSQEFSEAQLEIHRKKYEEAQTRLAEFEEARARESLDHRLGSSQNLAAMVAEADNAKLEIRRAADEAAELRVGLNELQIEQTNLIHSDRLSQLRGDLLDQIKELEGLIGKYTWKDPVLVDFNLRFATGLNNIQGEITDIALQLFPNLDDLVRDRMVLMAFLEEQAEIIRRRHEALTRGVNRIKDQLATGPEYQRRLARLQNEIDAAHDIYKRFQSQLVGSQIAQAVQKAEAESKYRVIEPSNVPRAPVFPDRMRIGMAAAVFGLGLGLVLVFLAEYADRSLRTIEEIETALETPVVGQMPKIDALPAMVKAMRKSRTRDAA